MAQPSEVPPLGSGVVPVVPLPARAPDLKRLARARGLLSGQVRAGRLGAYRLYTDVAEAGRLALLDGVAGSLEAVYTARYGLRPIGQPAEAIVVYARESDYRRLLARDPRLAELGASGHYDSGIVALFDGGRAGGEVAGTLAHELTHLLNRRSIGPLLPSWLEEGLADDLALGRFEPDGRLVPGTLGGVAVRAGQRIQLFGAHAALDQLARALGSSRAWPVAGLLALDWETFVRAPGGLAYTESAFFVRYLVAGESGALAPPFRAFLAAVAAGGSADSEALRSRLGRSWEELDKGFAAWVQEQAAASLPDFAGAVPDSP